jgi:hypothetical protein
LAAVGYADEAAFDFYGADGDLAMRLNAEGWTTIALQGAYAEHLLHGANLRVTRTAKSGDSSAGADMAAFRERWAFMGDRGTKRNADWNDPARTGRLFWRTAPLSCIEGVLRRLVRGTALDPAARARTEAG